MAEGESLAKHPLLTEVPDLRFCRGAALQDKVGLFNKHVDKHLKEQQHNPFSGHAQARPVIDKNDPNYGRPIEGSKSDLRGKKAMNNISKEILELCEVIHENGHPIPNDREHIFISFGELFNIYTTISNKVVGILLRARKHQFVDFEGECLFQRRDDDVPIILIKTMEEIRSIIKSGFS